MHGVGRRGTMARASSVVVVVEEGGGLICARRWGSGRGRAAPASGEAPESWVEAMGRGLRPVANYQAPLVTHKLSLVWEE